MGSSRSLAVAARSPHRRSDTKSVQTLAFAPGGGYSLRRLQRDDDPADRETIALRAKNL